jgi:hypothetical protein
MLAECRLHGCHIVLILFVVLAFSPQHSMSKAVDATLRRSFQGSLLGPDDEEYSDAHRIWNGLGVGGRTEHQNRRHCGQKSRHSFPTESGDPE